eukprot:4257477-Amphidinium_carterae.1
MFHRGQAASQHCSAAIRRAHVKPQRDTHVLCSFASSLSSKLKLPKRSSMYTFASTSNSICSTGSNGANNNVISQAYVNIPRTSVNVAFFCLATLTAGT